MNIEPIDPYTGKLKALQYAVATQLKVEQEELFVWIIFDVGKTEPCSVLVLHHEVGDLEYLQMRVGDWTNWTRSNGNRLVLRDLSWARMGDMRMIDLAPLHFAKMLGNVIPDALFCFRKG